MFVIGCDNALMVRFVKMDNFNEILKAKSVHANQAEFFVFLPNDLKRIKVKVNKKFDDAIAAKNEGNDNFRKKEYDAAIKNYDVSIEKFECLDKPCDLELAACYQNRAAAKEYKKIYEDSISDASKAIQLNGHYAKAYFRRANAYKEQRKFYCALQDIVQAYILERFKNKIYNNMVGVLLTLIGTCRDS